MKGCRCIRNASVPARRQKIAEISRFDKTVRIVIKHMSDDDHRAHGRSSASFRTRRRVADIDVAATAAPARYMTPAMSSGSVIQRVVIRQWRTPAALSAP